MTQAQRVFITGLGAVSSLGSGYDSLVNALAHPVHTFVPVPRDWLSMPGGPDTYIAPLSAQAELDIAPYETVATDRSCAMALCAADQAWQQTFGATPDATAPAPGVNRRRYGVYWGTGMGGLNSIETLLAGKMFVEKKAPRPMTVVRVMSNAAAAQLAIKYKLQGANQTTTNACSSAAIAIGDAFHAIRRGALDMALVGGSESMLMPGVLSAWGALRVLATVKDAPTAESACKPFSTDRCGLVMGEGAAAFVIESHSHMVKRGAVPLAEIVGYASSCDAHSMVHPDSEGQAYAIAMALQDAQLLPSDIDNINAHATSTDTGDIEEAKAIAAVFGTSDDGLAPPAPIVSATKSIHGHLLGAAAAIEAAMCVTSLLCKTVAATLGSEPREPSCKHLRLLVTSMHKPDLNYIMSNSFAFGGSNASLIFKSVT